MSLKIENYIVMEETIYQGGKEEYLDAATELADEKQMPVLVQLPCEERKLFILPLTTNKG